MEGNNFMGQDPHEIMAQGMGMSRFSCEDENAYIARILYSAISEWTKTTVLDRSIDIESENWDAGNIRYTKHHVTRKCNLILSAYLDIYPDVKKWFYPKDEPEIQPTKVIQERLEFSGFIVPGPENIIQLPPDKYAKVSEDLYLLRGTSFGKDGEIHGLGWYVNRISEQNAYSLEELFLIPQIDAKDTVLEYSRFAEGKFTLNSVISDVQRYFDPLSRRVFSESWEQLLCHPWELTVYRNNLFDYGLAKQENGEIYTLAFPDHIIKLQDVRRFMYGLRYLSQNSEHAKITIYNDAIKIKLNSFLPGREGMLFYMITWPVRNILDRTEFITSPVFLLIIIELLENLNIKVLQNG
ncbi:hypothetical protein [Methanoplanus endosymbiosus]|uniref:Uncharacterized protein n=1 Tax=Methanoplanus endosymbiosus TaxID=33865 RepID=A0A9E7PKY9_9EURY|nr:hypothetical protein [Methanoplanus endosymbiosus]UUX91217.1 hypothetical protein L6E24_07440 [Methanoplanus endosymbiosus]